MRGRDALPGVSYADRCGYEDGDQEGARLWGFGFLLRLVEHGSHAVTGAGHGYFPVIDCHLSFIQRMPIQTAMTTGDLVATWVLRLQLWEIPGYFPPASNWPRLRRPAPSWIARHIAGFTGQ